MTRAEIRTRRELAELASLRHRLANTDSVSLADALRAAELADRYRTVPPVQECDPSSTGHFLPIHQRRHLQGGSR